MSRATMPPTLPTITSSPPSVTTLDGALIRPTQWQWARPSHVGRPLKTTLPTPSSYRWIRFLARESHPPGQHCRQQVARQQTNIPVRFIEVVAFLAHQASLENLEVPALVRDLSLSPRTSTAKETAGQLAELLRSQPVDTWKEGIAGKGGVATMAVFKILTVTSRIAKLSPELPLAE